MGKTVHEIREEVLALSASERASLAQALILSLDDPEDLELSPEQETEIQRRLEIVRDGRASGRPVESIVADARARYDEADLTRQALALPVEERVVLAQRVWDSMGHFVNSEVEKDWMDEADRRWREIEEGKVQCLPADQVMKHARESLRR